jgi:hypothetical protein
MKRSDWFTGFPTAIAVVALATAAVAQPPEDGPPERGPGGPPHDHLRAALDTDGDHELSAEEIKNATAAVAKLDRNGDGRIDNEEFRPPRPPGPPRGEFSAGRPPRGEGFEGRPPREGRRPPGDGPRPEGGPTRPSSERLVERAMSFDADGDGKLDKAEMEKFAGEMQQRMRGGRGGPGGPPPEGGDRPERPRRPE